MGRVLSQLRDPNAERLDGIGGAVERIGQDAGSVEGRRHADLSVDLGDERGLGQRRG